MTKGCSWSPEGGRFRKPAPFKGHFPEAPVLKGWNFLSPHLSFALPWGLPTAQHRFPINLPSRHSRPSHTLCLSGVLRTDPPCPLSTKHLGIPGLCNFTILYFKLFFDKWASIEVFFLHYERKLPLSPYLSETPLPCFFHLALCFAQAMQKGGFWVWDNTPAMRRMRMEQSGHPCPNPDAQQPCRVLNTEDGTPADFLTFPVLARPGPKASGGQATRQMVCVTPTN